MIRSWASPRPSPTCSSTSLTSSSAMRAVARAVGGALAAGRERLLGHTRPDVWVAHPMATERDHPSAATAEGVALRPTHRYGFSDRCVVGAASLQRGRGISKRLARWVDADPREEQRSDRIQTREVLSSPPTEPERRTDQRFRWSEPVWSPPPESNRRPHPYHGCALPTELGGRELRAWLWTRGHGTWPGSWLSRDRARGS